MAAKTPSNDLLASTAVFAEMANKSILLRDVLAKFILATYSLDSVRASTTEEVRSSLLTHFEFDIPSSVVKNTLKNLKKKGILTQDQGRYIITSEERSSWLDFHDAIRSKEKLQQDITNKLLKYIEKLDGPLSDEDKTTALSSLTNLLFDKNYSDRFTPHISTFIINSSKDENIATELNLIKEGVIILRGIKYNPNINEISPWRTPLTIYLDQEHLFSFCGLNGLVHKQNMSDLISMTDKINSTLKAKTQEKAIKFKYLESTKDDINSFFNYAKGVIDGRYNLTYYTTAMNAILSGTTQVSEIIEKQTTFFETLENAHIIEAKPVELYSKHAFNIEDDKIIQKYKGNIEEKEIHSILKQLNTINHLRRGRNKMKFEDIGHILMTDSSNKLAISLDAETKFEETDFPYAKPLDYITEYLWFRLNRGLGFSASLPSSLEMITKAQTLLSNEVNSSIKAHYEKLLDDVDCGEKNLEFVQKYYLNLRANIVKPEDITPQNAENKLRFHIDEQTLEQFTDEMTLLRHKANKYDQIERDARDAQIREEKEELKKLEERSEYLRTKCNRKERIYRNTFLTILITIVIFMFRLGWLALQPLIRDSDTPISITSLITSVLSLCLTLLGFVKWGIIKSHINQIAQKEYLDYRKKHFSNN